MKKEFGIIAVLIALVSCKKNPVISEEPSLTGTDAVKSALVSADWVLKHTALIYSPDLVDNSSPEVCKIDDTYKFKLSGDAEVHFGNTHCSTTLDSGSYGTWELLANGATLKQTVTRDVPGFINGEVIYWTVDYITQTKLRIKRAIVEPGKSYTQMDTYVRR
ncbi:MAG: hypothetical protein KF741_10700 [Ferruginibacter sp.]|nr:hypothetical protein [Bacteroidota bacterium]MBX2919699.1 hypothetical protein [Ferruginibacter sp.]MCC7379649.1 hypothetical protein [Chitinophagaceae bacterium]